MEGELEGVNEHEGKRANWRWWMNASGGGGGEPEEEVETDATRRRLGRVRTCERGRTGERSAPRDEERRERIERGQRGGNRRRRGREG